MTPSQRIFADLVEVMREDYHNHDGDPRTYHDLIESKAEELDTEGLTCLNILVNQYCRMYQEKLRIENLTTQIEERANGNS